MSNRTVWQDKPGVPGIIRESPVPSEIAENELVVQVHAWALNPADVMIQDTPLPFITYPVVLGEDIAGTVETVGTAAASRFKAGDRILGFARGAGIGKPEQGGFQDYVILEHTMACKIPDSLSFVDAAVFPLCIVSAANGLFSREYLGMPFPKANPPSTDKSVFIWGGSSGIGSNSIQLSKAAGFEVITACSPSNFEYVRTLGADKVFDRNTPSVIDDIAAELDKGTCQGIFHTTGDVTPSCQIAHRSKQKLFVASSNFVPEGVAPEGVEAKMVFASGDMREYGEICKWIFGDFLPVALEGGRYKVAPAPEVVGVKGLDGVQGALDLLKKGVSARKIVVEAK